MKVLFDICACFLEWLGKTLNLTYMEISVIFNLWLQGAVLTLSAIAPLVTAIVALTREPSTKAWWLVGGFSIYSLIYIIGFIAMLWHYRLPYTRAFKLCVVDLQRLAEKLGTTYDLVNIVIFVVVFLILVIGNIWMATAILK